MKALQKTMEGLHQVQVLQEAMQREISSIQSKTYETKGRFQFALSDSTKKSMISDVRRRCNQHCSRIYDEINQARTQEGLPELSNQFNERK